jgi:hypothetical protein
MAQQPVDPAVLNEACIQPATVDLHQQNDGSLAFPAMYRAYWGGEPAIKAWRRYEMATNFCWAEGIDSWTSFGQSRIGISFSTSANDTDNARLTRRLNRLVASNYINAAIKLECLAYDDQGGVGQGFSGTEIYPSPAKAKLTSAKELGFAAKASTIAVSVLMMDGSSTNLNLPGGATVMDVKEALSQAQGIPVTQQSLSALNGVCFLPNSELVCAEQAELALLVSDPAVWRICTVLDTTDDAIKIGYRVGAEDAHEWVARSSSRFNCTGERKSKEHVLEVAYSRDAPSIVRGAAFKWLDDHSQHWMQQAIPSSRYCINRVLPITQCCQLVQCQHYQQVQCRHYQQVQCQHYQQVQCQ